MDSPDRIQVCYQFVLVLLGRSMDVSYDADIRVSIDQSADWNGCVDVLNAKRCADIENIRNSYCEFVDPSKLMCDLPVGINDAIITCRSLVNLRLNPIEMWSTLSRWSSVLFSNQAITHVNWTKIKQRIVSMAARIHANSNDRQCSLIHCNALYNQPTWVCWANTRDIPVSELSCRNRWCTGRKSTKN